MHFALKVRSVFHSVEGKRPMNSTVQPAYDQGSSGDQSQNFSGNLRIPMMSAGHSD
jgi:hypothetical protein